MPLFAVSNEGRVYRLPTPHDGHSGSTNDNDCREDFVGGPGHEYATWQELAYLGVELKLVSAGGRSLWAVGGDRQIYVLVHSVDLPIRIKEEAFENQRWIPLEGFSSRLLPTDRSHFSSEDGLRERKLEAICLPSLAWQWEESSWRVEASLNGQPLDTEGWTYAVDFPATYHPHKQWSSCVRRRKWVRHRIYAAVDAWSALEPLNVKDPAEEPFIDVSVGGQSIVGAPKGHLSIWAVTAKGRVLFRQDVNWACPEGVCWEEVPVAGGNNEEGQEVKQVGVGPMGDAWCTLWDGRALVRAGVDREHLKGNFWVELEPPSPGANLSPGISSDGSSNAPLSQISVGQWGAWAVTVDGRVWYRRGVRNSGFAETKDDTATGRLLGLSWVEMVGCMSVVSVGPNDQVWGIGLEDRHLYIRTGVLLPTEPTGKTWRRLYLPVRCSASSVVCQPFGAFRNQQKSRPLACSYGSDGSLYSIEESLCPSASSPVKISRNPDDVLATGNVVHLSSYRNRSAVVASGAVASALAILGNSGASQKSGESEHVPTIPNSNTGNKEDDVSELETNSAFGHPQESEDEWDDFGSEEDACFEESLERRRNNGDNHPICSEPLWAWVSGGACIFDLHQNLPWFTEGAEFSDVNVEDGSEGVKASRIRGIKGARVKDIWRNGILYSLRERRNRETSLYKYERAVQVSSWVKTGKAFCCLPYPPSSLEECYLELEWVCGQTEMKRVATQHSGTLTILSPNRSRTLLQWNISEIRCVACSKGWASGNSTDFGDALSPTAQEADFSASSKLYSHPRLAIHAVLMSTPLRLQFGSEKDLEDWTSTITSVCCQVQGIQGPPNSGSIWATTYHGEVFVFDPTNLQEQWENDGNIVNNYFKGEEENGHYAMEWCFRGREPPYTQILHNGMPPGSVVVVKGTVASKAKRFSMNLVLGSAKKSQRTIALHFNPRFGSDGTVIIVRNTMKEGTWQEEESDGDYVSAFIRGHDFSLSIISTDDGFKLIVEGPTLAADNESICSTSSSSSSLAPCILHNMWFKHRISPGAVSHLEINGNVSVATVSYASPNVIVNMDSVFWRQMGGHFRQVEASPLGVVWALAYDGTPWVHTGGWGGAFLEGMGEESGSARANGTSDEGDSSGSKVQPMNDTRVVHVYENQRWNPLTGYSSVGLPTDRPSWSDRSGRHRRSRDSTKLPSRHWHWATDWSVDFGVSGGVDSEGWQYAIDFPASYHASKCFTDYVRRRRWMRVAKLSTKGPWRPLPHIPLAEEESRDGDGEGVVSVWAIAANTGEVLFRHGITKSCPTGVLWECVAGGEQPFVCISCGGRNQVWAIGRNGAAYWRFGIKSACPTGQVWVHVEPPPGHKLKQISVAECEKGSLAVWALDTHGILYIRKEMTTVFPEGTHWHAVVSGEMTNEQKQIVFGHVSIGPGGEVWAASAEQEGTVLRKLGSHTLDYIGDLAWSRGVSKHGSKKYIPGHCERDLPNC